MLTVLNIYLQSVSIVYICTHNCLRFTLIDRKKIVPFLLGK